jgi:ABC-2 type transport system ATP-binding protein
MSAIIEVNQLQKKYGDFHAVDGVSFTVDEGEIFSLLGPNGAGKTTTISMLSTLIPPSSGDAVICGESITNNAMAVRKCIGVVPQEIALYETLSTRENLRFWGEMYGMGGKPLKKRVDEVLEIIGLTDKASQRIKTYSGGMKRRVNIGVGLLHNPRVIFMDEPTVGIDPQSRRSILDTVKDLNRQGVTVLYTTHYMEEAEELSHRVGIIDHGKLIALGTQDELTAMVGENETLRLHLDDNLELQPLMAEIQGMDGVFRVSGEDHAVAVVVRQAGGMLAPVITRANDLGFRIRSVDIQEPNLETVFLQLTGRALRD